MDAARELMKMIKAERYFGNPPKLTSQWIAETVHDFRERLPFASFFRDDSVLVPLPSSSLMQRDTLWVPERISTALVKVGLGKESTPLLVRETPVPKAAWSKPGETEGQRPH